MHLPSVSAGRRLVGPPPRVGRDDRFDPTQLPRVAVIRLAVVTRVGGDPLNEHLLKGIIKRVQKPIDIRLRSTLGDPAQDQVRGAVHDDAQLGEAVVDDEFFFVFPVLSPTGEVGRDMPGLEAGRVDGPELDPTTLQHELDCGEQQAIVIVGESQVLCGAMERGMVRCPAQPDRLAQPRPLPQHLLGRAEIEPVEGLDRQAGKKLREGKVLAAVGMRVVGQRHAADVVRGEDQPPCRSGGGAHPASCNHARPGAQAPCKRLTSERRDRAYPTPLHTVPPSGYSAERGVGFCGCERALIRHGLRGTEFMDNAAVGVVLEGEADIGLAGQR